MTAHQTSALVPSFYHKLKGKLGGSSSASTSAVDTLEGRTLPRDMVGLAKDYKFGRPMYDKEQYDDADTTDADTVSLTTTESDGYSSEESDSSNSQEDEQDNHHQVSAAVSPQQQQGRATTATAPPGPQLYPLRRRPKQRLRLSLRQNRKYFANTDIIQWQYEKQRIKDRKDFIRTMRSQCNGGGGGGGWLYIAHHRVSSFQIMFSMIPEEDDQGRITALEVRHEWIMQRHGGGGRSNGSRQNSSGRAPEAPPPRIPPSHPRQVLPSRVVGKFEDATSSATTLIRTPSSILMAAQGKTNPVKFHKRRRRLPSKWLREKVHYQAQHKRAKKKQQQNNNKSVQQTERRTAVCLDMARSSTAQTKSGRIERDLFTGIIEV